MEFDAEGRVTSLGFPDGTLSAPLDAGALTEAFAIALRDGEGRVIEVVPQSAPKIEKGQTGDAGTLDLTWEVSGTWGSLTVRGHVELPSGSALSAWTLEIENRTEHAIWQVAYPRLSGLTAFAGDGGDDYVAAARGMGCLTPHPIACANRGHGKLDSVTRDEYGTLGIGGDKNGIAYSYPGMWTMQFMPYGTRGRGGIYFAAHDGQALYKRFGMYGDGADGVHAALIMKQYPEDRTAPGADFASFYPTIVGLYRGEWWDASIVYRQWALQQIWCGKGPIKDRTDIPAWAKELDLWYWNYQFHAGDANHPANHLLIVDYLKRRFGCDLAFHWYGCNGENCVTGPWRGPDIYPGNATIRRTLINAVKKFHEMGVHCLPYMNPRLWNDADDDWLEMDGFKWVAVDENGKSADQWGLCGHTICPTAKPAQEIYRRMTNRMIDEIGMDGAYLDQVSSCFSTPCFSPDHDHAPGGHDHWFRGYRDWLGLLQKDAKARSADHAFTSESVIECYLDLLDLDLSREITNPSNVFGDPQTMPIPMFHSVYHDYHMTYGTVSTFRPTGRVPVEFEWFCCGEALALIGGGQLMVSGASKGDENRPEVQPYYDYMNTLVRARGSATRFFNLGTWRSPLDLECARVSVLVTADGAPKENIPAVLNGCFELDGELCIVLVNHTPTEQRLSFTLNPETYGFGPGPLRLSVIHPKDEPVADGVTGSLRHEATLPPRSAQVMLLSAP
jgi:hypothetical protein